jgi:hypothetical protein
MNRRSRKGETALVVSSGGTIAAAASLLALPEHAFVALNQVVMKSAITKIAVGRSGTTLISFSDHAHLEEADGSLITYR